jgi:dienelactone hydrolase
MIVVDQPIALVDTPIRIEVRAFPPREPVTLTVVQTFPSGSSWQSQATFLADENGSVDVAHQAPVAGSYDGASPMGLFWSAERLPSKAQPAAGGTVIQPIHVLLEARSGAAARAELTIERRAAGPGVTRHPLRLEGLLGTLFLPPGGGPHPAVIVLSGGGGGIDEYRGAILASHGYAALSLGYFGLPGLPRGLVNIPLEYFEAVVRWMRAQSWLRDHFLAVWGESRGGELALLLGSSFPEINAVVAWVPSGVVFWALGLAEPGDTRPRAAWTFRGKALPYLQEFNSNLGTAPAAERGQPVAYTPFYLCHLQDRRAIERAAIAVENTKGPVLLVSGSDDQMWPSSALADIAFQRLQAHEHPYAYKHLKYAGAGHLIRVPYGPLSSRALGLAVDGFQGHLCSVGGTPKADADAGVDAWKSTLDLLRESADRRRHR